jgi:hypothetical protein
VFVADYSEVIFVFVSFLSGSRSYPVPHRGGRVKQRTVRPKLKSLVTATSEHFVLFKPF